MADAQSNALEVFEEMQGQLQKEVDRLLLLRKVREDDPGMSRASCIWCTSLTQADLFYIVDNEPALEGVDVATNATTQASAFTRYTVAPTTLFSQTTRVTGYAAHSAYTASLIQRQTDKQEQTPAQSKSSGPERHRRRVRVSLGESGTTDGQSG